MCVCAGVCVTSGDEAASWDCEMKDAVGGEGENVTCVLLVFVR